MSDQIISEFGEPMSTNRVAAQHLSDGVEISDADVVFYEYNYEEEYADANGLRKKYKCEHCDAELATPSSLNTHIKRTHLQYRPFQCPYCSYAAHANYILTYHIRTHTKEKPFACTECDFRTACAHSLLEHKRRHSNEKPYSCKLCDFTGRTSKIIYNHMVTHKTERNFACDHCEYRGKTRNALKLHLGRHGIGTVGSRGGNTFFSCDYCPYTASSKQKLHNHTMRHTGEHPFTCEVCNLGLCNRDLLRKHMMVHTGERPYKCRFCDYRASQSTTRSEHERLRHIKEKLYTCETCGEKFVLKKYLARHINANRCVRQLSVYPCFVCDDRFQSPQDWKIHLTNHLGSKFEFKCAICHYSSPSRMTLEKHKARAHVEKKISCEFCSKKYRLKDSLRGHIERKHKSQKKINPLRVRTAVQKCSPFSNHNGVEYDELTSQESRGEPPEATDLKDEP